MLLNRIDTITTKIMNSTIEAGKYKSGLFKSMSRYPRPPEVAANVVSRDHGEVSNPLMLDCDYTAHHITFEVVYSHTYIYRSIYK